MSSNSNIEFSYKGKVYQAVPERKHGGCSGCAFHGETLGGCTASAVVKPCHSDRIIWQEKQAGNEVVAASPETAVQPSTEPEVLTWTLDEIESAYNKLPPSFNWGLLERMLTKIHQEQALKQDPEYQKYLELKAKFESKE